MKLHGSVGDVEADVDQVDELNMEILPRLRSILDMEYFHYIQVNLERSCPFFKDDLRCVLRDCRVDDCPVDEVPLGLRTDSVPPGLPSHKYSKIMNTGKLDPSGEIDCQLSNLDNTLSDESRSLLHNWTKHDEMNETLFCELDDERTGNMIYVDLLKNPERYTGYKGEASNRIWYMIYAENCFNEEGQGYASLGPNSDVLIFPLIYLIMCTQNCWAMNSLTEAEWAPNVREFKNRFHPDSIKEGLNLDLRCKALLHPSYLVKLRAFRAQGANSIILKRQAFYTGDELADRNARLAVHNLLNIIQSKGNMFDERQLFAGNSQETKVLKQRFREHFRNISRIMDCVGCKKCRLWGKIQTQGMGTALKILFSEPDQRIIGPTRDPAYYPGFQLRRQEIVALFNAFGRLSTSVGALRDFCHLMKNP
ncbi:putative endoplasmic reticulum oxidoreductin 1 (ERO1) [Fasciola gigantica]|uniref:Putative endoplasmic reticulum oxidoreductin 1 (ERO1) n=1 Tax=Fasciola gigantica TaxID=46835 RepID=A0A504X3M3_FASGI|nr:putative endoplasmic reticulum oxidoreductin 1 (ERO1) [Fasciola gigantica]